jgi:hypothetical protein
MHVQTLFTQVCPAAQALLQLPQLRSSLARSEHAFEQQAGAVPVQTLEHAPQLATSFGTGLPPQQC